MEEKLDKLFHLKERGTNVRTEVLAGLTAFVTAAYVLAVNPSVMSATGMDSGAVFTATALVCFLGTLVMALLTNYLPVRAGSEHGPQRLLCLHRGAGHGL